MLKSIDLFAGIGGIRLGFERAFGEEISTFNARTDNTNFVYEVVGNINDDLMDKFNSTYSVKASQNGRQRQAVAMHDRMALLKRSGCDLKFRDTATTTAKGNLILSGGMEMPIIVGNLLKYYYFENESQIAHSGFEDAVAYITAKNVAGYPLPNVADYYRHKVKNLLFDMFSGMRLSTTWSGKSNINGGYIGAANNGYGQAYNSCIADEFKEFLLAKLGFESPSASRHKFMEIYKEGGRYFIKLNLQVRFR